MEIYKKIFGKYEVSNLGNVRNSNTGKILKPIEDKYGYLCVCLHERGKNYYKKIHRMVAQAFVENKEDKHCIDHIDGNRKNNVYTNLRWVTPKENSNNPITLAKIREKCRPPKNTPKPVICVETNEEYLSIIDASKSRNIDDSCIAKCCKGKRQTAGGYHWKYKYEKEVI